MPANGSNKGFLKGNKMIKCETCMNWDNGDFSIYCVDCRSHINYKERENRMNYMPEVLKMLGVEIGEKFILHGVCSNPCHFNDNFKIIDDNCELVDAIKFVLIGELKIEKLPWKPKEDDYYYFVDAEGGLSSTDWRNHVYDYNLYNTSNFFRTKEEITSEIKERILKEMKEKYKNS